MRECLPHLLTANIPDYLALNRLQDSLFSLRMRIVFRKMRNAKTHPNLPLVERGKPLAISVDGQPFTAYEGETIAAVLAASSRRAYHYSPNPATTLLPGFFCGIGICYGCIVLVDGDRQRACMTTVIAGMQIRTRSEASG